jgi:hypothetical protein
MAVQRGRTDWHILDSSLNDLFSIIKFTTNALPESGMEDFGIYLWIHHADKQQTRWYHYTWNDAENDLYSIILEINFLINDPKIEYFVVALGNLTQDYNDDILDVYSENASLNQLTILGRSKQGEYLKNIFKLVEDKSTGEKHLEEIQP